jgi:hypothetical protein
MREAVFILIVVVGLMALTAIRYRREIVTVIRFWRQIQTARTRSRESETRVAAPGPGIQLVKCIRCGKWIPESEAIRIASGYSCRIECCPVTAANVNT